MPSNITELQNHLRKVFDELFKTQAMVTYGNMAGEHIKESVTNKMGNRYSQSGRMRKLWDGEVPNAKLTNKTGTKFGIGLADVDEWNIETLREAQRATFTLADGSQKTIGLRPEPSLPAWIIMEFGRQAGSGSSSAGIPKDFMVKGYSRDSSKQSMFGPSSSYHFRKPVFFMTNLEDGHNPKTHPGIKAGRFFRDGLKESQEGVYNIMLLGLEESMKELASKYGGVVESL